MINAAPSEPEYCACRDGLSGHRQYMCRSGRWKPQALHPLHRRSNTSTKSSGLPAPPDAITGMWSARDTACRQLTIEPRLYSIGVHGCKQDLPRAEFFTFLCPVDCIDAFVDAAALCIDVPASPPALRRASIASTTACAPNSRLSSPINSGRRTAAVLMLTLSAPDIRIVCASAMFRMPPPTVSGINTLRAVRPTTSAIVRAIVAGGRNVEKDELVSALLVVTLSEFDRVSGVAQIDKIDSLHDTTVCHVEARNDAFG